MHESAAPGSDTHGIAGPAEMLMQSERLAYSVPEAAVALGQGERTVWGLVRSGAIRSYKVGAARRISRQALLDFIEQQENAAA